MKPLKTLLVLAALTAAGCGDDGGGGGGDEVKTSSKADYIAKADAVCKQANEDIAKLNVRANKEVQEAGDIKKPEDALKKLAAVLEDGADLQKKATEDFKAIKPPDSEKAAVDKLVAVLDKQVELVGKVADVAKRGDLADFNKLITEQGTDKEASRAQAVTFGFKECGSGQT